MPLGWHDSQKKAFQRPANNFQHRIHSTVLDHEMLLQAKKGYAKIPFGALQAREIQSQDIQGM